MTPKPIAAGTEYDMDLAHAESHLGRPTHTTRSPNMTDTVATLPRREMAYLSITTSIAGLPGFCAGGGLGTSPSRT